MTVGTPPRAGILCDGHLLTLEPYDGGHLRITVPRQATALADALRTLAEEVRDV